MAKAVAWQGERDFMHELYERYKRLMLYKARALSSDEGNAEEIVAETFSRLLNNASLLRSMEPYAQSAYIASAVRNTGINHLRRRETEQKYYAQAEEPPLAASAEEEFFSRPSSGIWELLRPEEQALLEAVYILGYSPAELAEQEGCSAAAIRMRLMRLREKLKKLLDEQRKEDERYD